MLTYVIQASQLNWPDCDVQLLSYSAETPDYPGTHGSGFLTRIDNEIFLVTARHCLGNINVDIPDFASRLMIPIFTPDGKAKLKKEDYIKFNIVGRVFSASNLDDYVGYNSGDMDLVLMKIDKSYHTENDYLHLLSRACICPEESPSHDRLIEIIIKTNPPPRLVISGFPNKGTRSEVDYENMHMISQGARLMGYCTGKGNYPHTMRIKITNQGEITNLNGFSGGSVFLKLDIGNIKRYVLMGMVISGKNSELDFITTPHIFNAALDILFKEKSQLLAATTH